MISYLNKYNIIKKPKPYKSTTVATLLLALANEQGRALNVTQTQKILYMVYAYFLAEKNLRIIDETPKMWPFGSVFPYTRLLVDYGVLHHLEDDDLKEIGQNVEVVNICRAIVEKYGIFDGSALSEWSCNRGDPWDKARRKYTDWDGYINWGKAIPDKYIKHHFSRVKLL